MEQKNIISNEDERKQRPCPVCLEMIDETAETCPYCDEPTYFKHAHTNDTAAPPATDYEPAKESMGLWKKVLIGFGGILAALFVIGLFLPDDESKDVAAADTEQLLDESSLSDANADAANYQLTLMGKVWDEDAILVLNIIEGDSITGTCTNVTSAEEIGVSGVCEDSEGTITIEMEGANSSWTLTPDESDNDLYHCVQYVSMEGGGEIDGGDFKVLERKNGNESE